ncbi:MAG: DUF3106 domain-containing protein [Myxococcota bacterium]
MRRLFLLILMGTLVTTALPDVGFAKDRDGRGESSLRDDTEMRRGEAGPGGKKRMRRVMKRIRESFPEFSAVERRILVREFRKLPDGEREQIRDDVRRVDSLSPKERKAVSSKLRGLVTNASQDVDQIERNLDRWEGMSKKEREVYRKQMRKLRSMSEEDRKSLIKEWESRQKKRKK